MVGVEVPEILGVCEAGAGPEVGEGAPPDHALLYHGGAVTIIPATSSQLTARGLMPYPHIYLTTEHALTLTRALATLHAHTLLDGHEKAHSSLEHNTQSTFQDQEYADEGSQEHEYLSPQEHGPSTYSEEHGHFPSEDHAQTEDRNEEEGDVVEVKEVMVTDRWTAQISQLSIVEANLSVLVDALSNAGGSERTVRRLNALRADLPTLTQFLQFASAMQKNKVPSMGPVCISDVWVPAEAQENDEEVLAVRLRGGVNLEGPPLRDAAWAWLTLMTGETLRDRYMELCDDYCGAFNKALLRREGAGGMIEELSYFDVMRDLGENFLHAFLTVIHKFVVSGKWFFDRQLYTDEGRAALVDLVSFLVDNGIVGSIFVL